MPAPLLRLAFAALCLAALSFSLLQSLAIPVMPLLQERYEIGPATSSWLLTGYLLAASIATPILGRIGDMHGKSRTLVVTMIVFAAGTALAALAHDIGLLIAARIVQGVGGGLFPLAFGIIRDVFPRERVAGAIGMISAMLAAGSALGIVVSGPIVDVLGLPWLFWTPFGVISVSALAIWRFVPESPVRAPGRVNWFAAGLLAGWLSCFLLAVTLGNDAGWLSPTVTGLATAAVTLFVGWLLDERRSRAPLIDLSLLARGSVIRANVLAVLLGAVMFSAFTLLPAFLQAPTSTGYGFGLSVAQSGMLMLPSTVVNFVCGFNAGRLERRLGSRGMAMIGCASLAAALVVVVLLHDELWHFTLVSVLQGFGLGLATAALPNLVVQSVAPDETGVATGINNNLRTMGGAVGTQLTVMVLTAGNSATSLPDVQHYLSAFAGLATAALLAAATSVFSGPGRSDRGQELGVLG